MRPMLATPGPLPVAAGWAYELKWDGIRLLVEHDGGRLRPTSRNGIDHTARWPQLRDLGTALPPGRTVLDGELVALDAAGRPSFGVLMSADAATPVTLCLFDVLVLAGVDLTGRPWQQRRDALVSMGLDGPAWRTPDVFDDGPALLAATAEGGLEGVVAKRVGSTYRPGVRSRDWVKVAHRRTTSVLVGGWQPGGADGLRSLVVGVRTPAGPLRPLGAVGSGISGHEATALLGVLPDIALHDCPFDPVPDLPAARWVEPVVVVDVEHLGRTESGMLRHPVFVRARPDLTPDDVADPEPPDAS